MHDIWKTDGFTACLHQQVREKYCEADHRAYLMPNDNDHTTTLVSVELAFVNFVCLILGRSSLCCGGSLSPFRNHACIQMTLCRPHGGNHRHWGWANRG